LVIEAAAPVRICDLGGWTDTWFGAPGRVLNIAMRPGVRVRLREHGDAGTVVLDVAAFGHRYRVTPGDASRTPRHPLLEAAVDACPPPPETGFEITVESAVPAGCAAGTSAAVATALVGALRAVRSERWAPRELAEAAHELEVGVLGGECGVQDQLSVALGGINYVEIDAYPEATVFPLPFWRGLGRLLTVVYLGRAHDSTGIHRKVIAELTALGPGVFEPLRDAAVAGRDAVLARDLEAFGRAMVDNTEAQRSLEPGLVGADAQRVSETAARHGALGWKVNGAGGDGGSVTVLSPTRAVKEHLDHSVTSQGWRVLPLEISPEGVSVRGTLSSPR
jgi:D-glycero-alpha-D-manno-heptose-7-phosphate kinase